MTEKCVSAHPSPVLTAPCRLLGHYSLFMKLIRPIVALMPIKI